MNPILAGVIALIVSFGLPILIGASRKSYGQEWYRRLKKPKLAAADLTVNVVFLIIYFAETIALYNILTITDSTAVVLFSVWFLGTAILSGVWSRLFFQYRRCDWALLALTVELPLLWWLVVSLYQFPNLAWLFLLPRAIWGLYAITVNVELYRLNADFWKSQKMG